MFLSDRSVLLSGICVQCGRNLKISGSGSQQGSGDRHQSVCHLRFQAACHVSAQAAIAKYISTALENHELEIRFRPTYNTKENRFVRAEYYMRMFVKDIGMVGSAEFVPIAEDTGQISSVEYYALEQVAREIAELEKPDQKV